MYEARPFGLFSYGDELTKEDQLFVSSIVKKVTNAKQLQNLESIKYTRELPDGGFVIVTDMGGVFRAITFKDPAIKKPEHDGHAHLNLPMLFSGSFLKAEWLRNGEGAELNLTDMCALRLGNYKVKASKFLKLQKFRVPYNPMYSELKPEIARMVTDDELMFTQYGGHRPTWYSGPMSEAVQIVCGFGRQDLENLPKGQDDVYEQIIHKIPEEYKQKINDEMGEARLPGYSGYPDEDGYIQYNYRFNNTDLISFDDNNDPWLVRVSSSGIWAMPLPIIPCTVTLAFREYIESVNDHEISKILDRFKGIPTGESFPMGADFFDWVRAGAIIKVGEVSSFYNKSSYSSVCNWSCDTTGTNLVNTCYDYLNGYAFGYTYQISLQLKKAVDRGWLKKQKISNLTSVQLKKVSSYLSQLLVIFKDNSARSVAVRYKLRRVSSDFLLSRLDNEINDGEINFWINLIMNPIAMHGCRTSILNSGYLTNGKLIKIPEPFISGCMSQDFLPQVDPPYNYPFQKIDTIVFAYYVDDELKVIKNFTDERKFHKDVESSFEKYMYVGMWEKTETSGWSGLVGNYYSTDFDNRRETSDVVTHTTIKGRDLGYGQPQFLWTAYFWMDGHLVRHRYYERTTIVKKTLNDRGLDTAFIVPYFCRNATLYARRDYIDGQDTEYTEGNMKGTVTDPYWYWMWTYSPIQWFSGGMGADRYGTKWRDNKPYPVNGNPIWVESFSYYPDESNEFADKGPWLGRGFPLDVYHLQKVGHEPEIQEYYIEQKTKADPLYRLHVSILNIPFELSKEPHNLLYYEPSPHPEHGNVVYENACKVTFGTIEYANVSFNLTKRKSFGYSKLSDPSKCDIFFGVINE